MIRTKKSIEKIESIVRKNTEKSKSNFSLTLVLAVFVFIVIIAAIAFATAFVYLFSETGVINGSDDSISLGTIVLCIVGFSLFFGASFSLILAQIPLKPMTRFINHMNALSHGNFKTRYKFRGALSNHKIIKEIEDSVNKLAEELEKTEMLRSDFVNNFSHEFKTPIVSIAGLARLINRTDISEAERARYLKAIEDESLRLAAMSTNILNLTKVESQSILTDVSEFNLSEQIRSCVLLLENKWVKKEIELDIDFDEHNLTANEELLKEVWINLIDNAIKFSPRGGILAIKIEPRDTSLAVMISNSGAEIPESERDSIFNKFYKLDKAHASEGNGIGLAIVKRIVELHKGSVDISCTDEVVTFTVSLPF